MVAYRGVGAALGLAVGVAQGAAWALRPRDGLIAPEPVRVEEVFTAEEVARARAFRRPQLVLGLASSGIELALLGALAARPPRALAAARPAVAGVALSLSATVAPLPVRAVARRRAVRVGLITQSWKGWAGDLAKSSAIGAGFAAAGAELAHAVRRRLPRSWWLPGAGGVVVFSGLMAFAGPVLLDPLFNKFRALPDGELRRDVLDLAQRAGVQVGEVYVVDASRRTTAANAYVTGVGATKRVVLFDTLIDGLWRPDEAIQRQGRWPEAGAVHFTRDETRLVVAHELAHVRFRDVRRALGFTALVAPAGALAVAALAPRRTDAAALPGLALAAVAVSAPVGVIANALSRRVEARADAFSLRLTDAPDPFVSFERRITIRNLADPAPPRLLTALFGTHPSTVERIGIARAYAGGRR